MANSDRQPAMGGLEWAMLVSLSLLWGGSFFFNKIAVQALHPLTVVFGRVSLAATILLLIAIACGHRLPLRWSVWRPFLMMGLINNVIPFTLILWGQTQIASGLAAILNATTPLWTVLVAHQVTTDERLTPARIIGVIAGLGGVVVMIGPSALTGLDRQVLGMLAVLGASLSYAFGSLFGRRFRGRPPLVTAAGQLSASALLTLPLLLLIEPPWTVTNLTPQPVLAVVGLAILSTAIGYVLYFQILSRAGSTNVVLVTFLVPVSAMMLGVLFLGEVITPWQLAGMAFIGLGLATIDGRLIRRQPRAHSPQPSAVRGRKA